jgi:hypothetical protein
MRARIASLAALMLWMVAAQAQPASQVILSGSWGPGPGQFAHALDGNLSGPETFTVDALGEIYVVDDMNDRIQHFDLHGKFISSYAIPHHEPVNGLAVSLQQAPNAPGVRKRTIYTAGGVSFERLMVGKVENKSVRPVMLPAPPIPICGLATDSRQRLFVETQGDRDLTPSVWLFDGNLRYRGHRDIAEICVQPGSDCLVGVAQKRAVDGQPGVQRWTVQLFSPVDMQYPQVKSVEIDVPAVKVTVGVTRLLGIDSASNLYVLVDTWGENAGEGQTRLLRYSPTGIQTGMLDLTAVQRTNRYIAYPERNVQIGPQGEVFVAIGTEKAYCIRRLSWPAAGR